MKRLIGKVGLVMCLFGVPARADGPSTVLLIEQLGSSDYKTREIAAKTLEAADESALPQIRQAKDHPDAETRSRVTQLIARLERKYLVASRLVSVSAEQQPVGDVFAELSRQTGYQLLCTQGQANVVSLQLNKVPFWEAIDAISRQTGHGLQAYGNDGDGLTFHRVGQFSSHVSYAGQFRVSAGGFHLSRSLDLAVRQQLNPVNPVRSESLTMTIQVVGEPKAPLMSLGQPRLLIAEDELGHSLIQPQARVYETNYHDYSYAPRNSVRQTQFQMHGPGAAKSLRHVKGSLMVSILAEKRPELIIDQVLLVKEKRYDGSKLSIDIDAVTESPTNQVNIRATVHRNGADGQHDFSWANSLTQRMELSDDKGQKFVAEGFNWETGSPTSVTGTFQFNPGDKKVGRAAKLVYYNWITSQHEIDFEFRDLPLP